MSPAAIPSGPPTIPSTRCSSPGNTEGSSVPDVGDGRRRVRRRLSAEGRFATVTFVVLAGQLAGLIAYSWYLYRRFDLLEDFAHNAQAWYLIGHGQLLPVDTVRIPTTPFLRDHFDLVMWPLSLLHLVSSSPFSLLVVQDVAVVAAELLTIRWVWSILGMRLERHRTAAGLLALLVLVANAWWYETVSFDIHLTPLGLPFLVAVGFSLYRGWWWRAAAAAFACVLFGAVVTELLVFVGLGWLVAFLVGRPVNRLGVVTAAAVSVVAGAWVLVVTGVGANQASNLASQYSYLVADNGHAGTLALLSGVLRHPVRALHMLGHRWHAMARPLITSGLAGILSPIGLSVAIGALVPAALAASASFSSVNDAFQTLPVVPFLLVGDVIVLLGLLTWPARSGTKAETPRQRRRWRRSTVVGAAAAALALTALVQDGRLLADLGPTWWKVSPAAASVLQTALDHSPPTVEVIASNGIMGRFSQRQYVYPLQLDPQTVPVRARTVLLVIASAGNEALTPAEVAADVRFARVRLGARPIAQGDGVSALLWTTPPTQRRVTFP